MKYKHFEHKECEYYPCHNIPVNCLFCYCPLFYLNCEGNFSLITIGDKEFKDCSNCTFPHEDYDKVIEKIIKLNSCNYV